MHKIYNCFKVIVDYYYNLCYFLVYELYFYVFLHVW